MKMIVGLGNPGKKFEKTRHNIGFEIIDDLVEHLTLKKSEGQGQELVFKGDYLEKKIIIIKPQSFMNNSGEIVAFFSNYFKVKNQDIIVVHDDIYLEIGKIRFKEKGSSGGHNGIKSIIINLRNEEFKRLKVGVGYNNKIKLEEWVIGKFDQKELEVLVKTKQKALELLTKWIIE